MKAFALITKGSDFYSQEEMIRFFTTRSKAEEVANSLNDRQLAYEEYVKANPNEYDDAWEDMEGFDYARVEEITIED